MKKLSEEKTNVMRLLDQAGIEYRHYCYVQTGETNGERVAEILGQNPDQVFKTLVTIGKSRQYYVFIIPVNRELDLKKAAKAVGEKSIAMIRSRELLPLTGYVHGGCSPIGMKKLFTTTIHESAFNYETIFFSAGKVGYQVQLKPEDLKTIIPIGSADLCTHCKP